jgi:hypothetical protein
MQPPAATCPLISRGAFGKFLFGCIRMTFVVQFVVVCLWLNLCDRNSCLSQHVLGAMCETSTRKSNQQANPNRNQGQTLK